MTVNYWALLLATALSFAFGGIWYSTLSARWLSALGRSADDVANSARPMPQLFAITIVCQLIKAWVLAGLLVHLAKAGVPASAKNGALTAAFCWLGFVATTLATNNGYQGNRTALTVIDGAHWLGVLLIQGLIIGWLGVR